MLVLSYALGLALLSVLALFFFLGEQGKFHRSTWAYFRQSGVHLRTLHGYIYARWTQQYIDALFRMATNKPGASKGDFWLARHYHGKILTHEHARCIVNLNHPIERTNLDQILPYPIARDLILQAPPEIVAYECVCRNGRRTHCEPTQVCMVVGKPFTDFVLEHHPGKSRRLTREAALQLLEEEHQRGHVHSAWFKDAMMNRFYAICNCCKCCCGGIRQMAVNGVPMVTSSGYIAQVDTAVCAQCGDCVELCPFLAITQNAEGVAHDWNRCLGCGVCEAKCQTGAITLVRDERKGVPLDVRALSSASKV
jgi:Pyruvate/2-oxoacid:ferredoxin oxidoreductase delta subunit